METRGQRTLLAVTVATRAEGKSPQAVAQARVEAALQAGYDEQLPGTRAVVGAASGNAPRVFVPEPHILQHYYLVRYFYGAASRRGRAADAAAGRLDRRCRIAAAVERRLPQRPQHPDDLHGLPGGRAFRRRRRVSRSPLGSAAHVPPVRQGLLRRAGRGGARGDEPGKGQALGGWGQYSLSPTMGAWNAHLFYLHWRYTGDDQFPPQPRLSVLPRNRRVPARTCSSPTPTAC